MPVGVVAVGVAVFAGWFRVQSQSSGGRAVATLIAVATMVAVLPATHASAGRAAPEGGNTEFVCARYPRPGEATCLAERRTDIPVRKRGEVTAAAAPSGFAPTDLQSAYHIPATPSGTPTVAVVDAYDDPNAESDLGVYRTQYGLPACTTANGCFSKVAQTGGSSLPAANSGWASEIVLDLEMVSAACPGCKILLVEAKSASTANLAVAANYAASKVGVGGAVSNSYGGSESSSDPSTGATYYDHPGVAVVAASGDEGYLTEFPAAYTYVISAGGTSLTKAPSTTRGWTESVWRTSNSEATGSGCSKYETKAAWQKDAGCSKRTENDLAAVADPNTGVAVYDSYGSGGWTVFGGTSVASPLIATMYAMSGNTNASAQLGSTSYSTTNGLGLNDVTTGTNDSKCPTTNAYLCTAEVGYDGPTGNGTPWGLAALGGPASTSTVAPFTVSANPSSVAVPLGGGSVPTTITTAMLAGNTAEPLTLTVTGMPSGVSTTPAAPIPVPAAANSSTPLTLNVAATTAPGAYSITVTATDGNQNTASTRITLTVPSPCSSAQQLANPGFESGNTGWTSTPDVIGEWTGAEAPHSGSWDAWMDGYSSKHTDSLTQTITVPGACHTATLTYWIKMITTQRTTDTDTFTATVGTTTQTLDNITAPTAWTQETVSYTVPANQTNVPVTLIGVQATSATTSFIVDDTSLTFS